MHPGGGGRRRAIELAGVVTDRDIACRCTADGKGPETLVKDAMTAGSRRAARRRR